MNFDIDIAIVVGFLILTLVVGLGHGQRVKTIKDYALGGRNFSTAALVATIVATWVSGSGFVVALSKTYTDGLHYKVASTGIAISFLIISYILIPRMGEFLGKTSIAESMGDLYGQKVRLITAVAGTIGSAGSVAVQFKVFGGIFSYFLTIPSYLSVIIAGMIATIYSAFGGIRAVTFTDILQFFAFGVIIPLLGFIIWNSFFNGGFSLSEAAADPKFNLDILFSSSNPRFFAMMTMFCYFAIPTFSAPTFQRIAMGSNIMQSRKAFFIAGLILVLVQIITAWVPFLLYSMNPNIPSDQLLGYIVDNYSYIGLKGLIIVAVIAFAMSTADSRINAASVLFTNDLYKVFIKSTKEIFVSRFFALTLGVASIIFALIETDILGVLIFANSFYYPIVTPPFLLTIFGFRSSGKSVLIGMCAGLAVTIILKIFPIEFLTLSQKMFGVLFAMFSNTVFLLGSHYLLKQSGGWIGIKDKSYQEKQKKKPNLQKRISCWLREFSFMGYCRKIAPVNDLTYTFLGIYFIVCTITTMYSTQSELLGYNGQLMRVIYPVMLVTGTVMAMYPIWPLSVATSIKKRIIHIWYPISIFYMLILFSCFFVLVSKFAMLQVLLFAINLMMASLLIGWRLTLPAIIIGFYLSAQLYQCCYGGLNFIVKLGSPEFILIYALLILSSAIIFFIKPKQEQQEAAEAKVDTLEEEVADLNEKVVHYGERVEDQGKEIERLGATSQRILNNVNHELRLPVGNVMNFAEMLNDGLGKFSEEQLKMLSDEVYQNSNRVSSMIMNMLDLATLEAKKIELNKSTINFGELVRDRVQSCRKMYLEDKKIDFEMRIEEDVLIKVDPNYMRQTVDNLVINAINFSSEGVISISVLRKGKGVEFTISDNGIGIPREELYDIFTPFKMGSNTESKAEGRGVGLALCKAAVEAHGGSISAASKGGTGAQFRFVLSGVK